MADEKTKKSGERATNKTAKHLREKLCELAEKSGGKFRLTVGATSDSSGLDGIDVRVELLSKKAAAWATVAPTINDAIEAAVNALSAACKFLEHVEIVDGELAPRGASR